MFLGEFKFLQETKCGVHPLNFFNMILVKASFRLTVHPICDSGLSGGVENLLPHSDTAAIWDHRTVTCSHVCRDAEGDESIELPVTENNTHDYDQCPTLDDRKWLPLAYVLTTV